MTLDLKADLHGHAIEFACDMDRKWFIEHPKEDSYVRDSVEHEFCMADPDGPCVTSSRTLVTLLGDGLRARQPASENI